MPFVNFTVDMTDEELVAMRTEKTMDFEMACNLMDNSVTSLVGIMKQRRTTNMTNKMKQLKMHEIRKTAMIIAGRAVGVPEGKNPWYDKLPGAFSTCPGSFVYFDNGVAHQIKIMSTEEARQVAPKARVAHRILIWDEVCQKWQYAGKYVQHCNTSRIHKAKSC